MDNIDSLKELIADKNYISSFLKLESIDDICINYISQTNTAIIMKAVVKGKNGDMESNIPLFIKAFREDSVYRDKSIKEVEFYQVIREGSNQGMPIPRCYDICRFGNDKGFIIILEDLSDEYVPADKMDFNNESVWFKCAQSLALFHATFMNSDMIGKGMVQLESKEMIEKRTHKDKQHFKKFMNTYEQVLGKEMSDILIKAFSIHLTLLQKELDRRNKTIINGDSHINNFMYSINENINPIIVDFQFWCVNSGVTDLAHLTRFNLPEKYGKDFHIALVEQYHSILVANGIKEYSLEECMNDYRMKVADMVLMPVWYYSYGITYDKWNNELKLLISNYNYLNCKEFCFN